jgi:hypothetical protein
VNDRTLVHGLARALLDAAQTYEAGKEWPAALLWPDARVTGGLPNKQVAVELGVSEITVKVHRGNVTRKMGAKSFADLVRWRMCWQSDAQSNLPPQPTLGRDDGLGFSAMQTVGHGPFQRSPRCGDTSGVGG